MARKLAFLSALLMASFLTANAQVTNSFPNDGNVGIGTTIPSEKLEVKTSSATHAIFKGNFSGIQGIQIERESGDNIRLVTNYSGYGGGLESSSKLRFAVNGNNINSPAVVIDELGRIGIGTSYTSNGILTVNGDGYGGIRIENDVFGKEASMRFRSKSSSGNTYHADISTFHNGANGFIGIKSPHNNFPGAGYKFIVNNLGNVGIGTTNPDSKLTVKGNIHAEEVKVDLSVPGPDYVFKQGYELRSLEEVQNYIKDHGHLPNIPSAHEMEANGIQLGEMNMKLLEKIEELTLYIIELESQYKRIDALEKRMDDLEKNN